MIGRPLFAYGILQDYELLTAVLGRRLEARWIAAAFAPGYRAAHYPDRIYPALVRHPGGRAEGLALIGLSRFEVQVLDAFEGDKYRRAIVPVLIDGEMFEADAYLPAIEVGAAAPDWSLAQWQAEHKARALVEDGRLAGEIRRRLAAARGGTR